MPATHSPRFEDALTWAYRLHASQERKSSGVPYISHLLGVCDLVLFYGGSEDHAIAALLHDAVEDQGVRRQEIEERFGPAVADIVEGCTDTAEHPKPPWRLRKEHYLAHLPQASDAVRLVSACDKLHNARSMVADYHQVGDGLWKRFRAGRDDQLWYLRGFVAACRQAGGPFPVLDELERTINDLEHLSQPPSPTR